MTCALLLVFDELRELAMHPPAPGRTRHVVDRGCEQRVLEANATGLVDPHELLVLGREQRILGHDRRRGRGERGGAKQRGSRRRGQPRRTGTHQALQCGRQRQRTGLGLLVPPELARDLDRPVRIARARLHDPHESRPVQRATEPRANHVVQCTGAQRLEGQLLSADLVLERVGPRAVHAHRHEHPDLFVDEPPQREAERRGRRVVQPLRVVDRDHRRSCVGKRAQHVVGRGRHGARIAASARLLVEERDLQRVPLRIG